MVDGACRETGVNGQPGEEYECAACHGVFERIRPDAEAEAEAREIGFWQEDEDMVILCEDCYQDLVDWMKGRTDHE